MKARICSLQLIFIFTISFSQEFDIQNFLNERYQIEDEEGIQQKLEQLSDMLQNPINLNQISRVELNNLFLIDQLTKDQIWDYIQFNSPLISIYELQSIQGINLSDLQIIAEFITAKPSFLKSHGSSNSPFRPGLIITRAEIKTPIENGVSNLSDSNLFLGKPVKFLSKMKFAYPGRYSFGLNLKNDAGEPFQFDKQNLWTGFDFLSFHLMIEKRGVIQKLLIGDYTLQFGQGLVLGNGFSFGKGSDLRLYKKVTTGIRPYTSLGEFGYFRGLVSTIQISNLLVTGFLSRNKLDANLNPDQSLVTSILKDGLHRTKREISRSNQLVESNVGLNIEYSKRNLNLGVNVINTKYEIPLKPSQSLSSQFSFRR